MNYFVNKRTGESEERYPQGLNGYVWLAPTELQYLSTIDLPKGLSLRDIIDEIDAYLDKHEDKLEYVQNNSYFYIRSWVNRRKEYLATQKALEKVVNIADPRENLRRNKR